MTATLAAILTRLHSELPALLDSNQNWQLTLHGGRNGHVRLEVVRTDDIVDADPPAPKPPRPAANNPHG